MAESPTGNSGKIWIAKRHKDAAYYFQYSRRSSSGGNWSYETVEKRFIRNNCDWLICLPDVFTGKSIAIFDDQLRFEVELEFVQCLSNAHYLKHLSSKGYFNDDRFKAYIRYLQYWRQPEYIKYVKYPYCIKVLELLLDDEFVESLSHEIAIDTLSEQITNHWICFKYDRE
ncbi:soh1family member protein [Theileria equi strain WA]|uniref:Mediator of RNA polymerase II transcription subunit 31 n=1 Tax=Theileria equi strain WA TaxID=1537102 RepID=L1LDX4_THEEQ|nr:soh1family member protein [Theileria equi strain WA]EKX73348.1 soh1family member protein [Theileria equi strain WA]|eukprot:XP_004832800.1 soh1family member protein [Theileria equi strain WA]